MSLEMSCTQCNAKTGEPPPMEGLTAEQVIDLCKHWMCSKCLDEADEALDDEDWEDSDYCECSAIHGEDEFSCGICSCCGLIIDINDIPV